MKTNRKLEKILRTARGRLMPGALIVLVLSTAGMLRAQTPAPKSATRAATASPSAPKGQHEGITVHGRWTIEVKNPDGTVTARREFENSVQPNGMNFLASLLAGNNSSGGLSILLNGADATYTGGLGTAFALGFSDPGPCLPMSWNLNGLLIQSGGPATGTTCLIASATAATSTTPASATQLGYNCKNFQVASSSTSSIAPCSTNLSVSAPTFTNTGMSGTAMEVLLTGSVSATATNSGNVNDVETVFTACTAASAPGNCLMEGAGGNEIAVNLLTLKKLDGPTNGDPAPVPYSPGQLIVVNVQISFQ